MKEYKYLLMAALVCLLAACNDSTSSTQSYVIQKFKEYSKTCVKFNRLTKSENSLDLSRCHPIDYYRTFTPKDCFGKIQECVAIKYQEGILYAVSESGAMYFWDNEMLTTNSGIISAVPTKDNYWLPARVRCGEVADYESIANYTNAVRFGVSIDNFEIKAAELGIIDKINSSWLPVITSK